MDAPGDVPLSLYYFNDGDALMVEFSVHRVTAVGVPRIQLIATRIVRIERVR